jgi:hypothetical protein
MGYKDADKNSEENEFSFVLLNWPSQAISWLA